MTVSAVQQKDSNNNDAIKNYAKSIAVGSLCGYALKWVFPLTKQEKDDSYKAEIAKIRKEAWQARTDEIELIRKSKNNIPEADEFIKMYDRNQLIYSNIKKLKDSSSEKMILLLNRINEAALQVKKTGRRKLELGLKDIRPTEAFILMGAFAGFLVKLIYNLFKPSPENTSSEIIT